MKKKIGTKYIVSGFIFAILIALIVSIALLLQTFTVGKQQIEVYSGSAEKYYDGTPLINNECGVSSGKLKTGHSINFVITGEQTEVGVSENTLEVTIVDRSGINVTDDYEIVYNCGELEVFEIIDLFITTQSYQKPYDGTPLVNKDPCVIEGLLTEHKIENLEYTGSQTEVGSSENSIAPFIIVDADGKDITERYNVIPNFGTLTVYDSNDSGDNGGEGGSGGGGEPQTNIWFRIKNDESVDRIYLRQDSKATYSGKGEHGFSGDVKYYYGKDEINPINYFAYTLIASGYDEHIAEIELLKEKTELLPYQPYKRLESDVGPLQYAVQYYKYDYSSFTISSLIPFIDVNPQYAEQELKYRNFVKKNYLKIDDSLKSLLLSLADENGIDINSQTLIEDVAHYIQNAAYYSYRWATSDYPSDKDMVTYFLTEEKAGVCRHFAAAATMMYRALGIPARYTTGYAVSTIQDEWYEYEGAGHAWVEIYIDGMGWVPIEVTGSNMEPDEGFGEGSGSGSGEGSGSGSGEGSGSGSGEGSGSGSGEGSGSGSGEGSGSGSGEPNGEVSSDNKNDSYDTTFFILTASEKGTYYLRIGSYGDYNGNGFDEANVYDTNGKLSPLYYIAQYLSVRDIKSTLIKIDCLENYKINMLPYYSLDGTPKGDIKVEHVSGSYVLTVYKVDDVSNIKLPNEIAQLEQVYRTFIYDNYLNIDTRLSETLKSVFENPSNLTDIELVNYLAKEVQNYATYNLKFTYEQGADVIEQFLEKKEGVCRHYAATATMLYRAYGIPARYVSGYAVSVQQNEQTEVKGKNAHAWVEVYIDGIGWVPVEVTGSSQDGSGLEIGGNGLGPGADEEEKNFIKLSSKPAEKTYDGTALVSNSDLVQFEGQLKDGGHRIIYENFKSITDVGRQVNSFDYKIVDADGNDVSSEYKFETEFADLIVKPKALKITTPDVNKVYDGKPLTNKEISSVGLVESHYITCEHTGSQTRPGINENSITNVKVFDKNNNDVTKNYVITCDFGRLEVVAP